MNQCCDAWKQKFEEKMEQMKKAGEIVAAQSKIVAEKADQSASVAPVRAGSISSSVVEVAARSVNGANQTYIEDTITCQQKEIEKQ